MTNKDIARTSPEEREGVLVTVQMIQGQFANWAVRLHPYRRPDRLFDVIDVIGEAAGLWEDGIASLRMKTFLSPLEVRSWLDGILKEDPRASAILKLWNTPRRYWTPGDDTYSPENDFISIGALVRNAAQDAWQEARRI